MSNEITKVDSDLVQVEKNDNTLSHAHKNHMSGSDIEVLDAESSDSNSIEVINSGEHTAVITSQIVEEACFDVNAHGYKPTPQSEKVVGNMETSIKSDITICGGPGCVGEYKEISSDNDSITIDETSSSPSSPSQISPNHRIVYNSKDSADSPDESSDLNNVERPGSLSLPRPLQYYEKHRNIDYLSDSCSDVSRSSSTAALIEEASRTPLTKHGTVTQEGDMIAFVADGLNDMIKMSSPLSRTGSSVSSSLQSPGVQSVSSMSSSTSAWSDATSSASEWSRDYSRMSRSPSILTASPDDIPSVDPRAVMELEVYASKVANSLQHMMGTLKNNLYKMSALSYHCLDAHKDGVDRTCDSVDSSIKSMYALMAKCEELSKCVQPVYKIHAQIKEIERLLDLFESQMAKEEK